MSEEKQPWWNSHQIRRFDYWPAQSPDLNPIERLWSSLERLICNERSEFKNIDELKAVLEAAWGEIHVDLADRLVGSVKDRYQAIIDAKGEPTKYLLYPNNFYMTIHRYDRDYGLRTYDTIRLKNFNIKRSET
ncbi:hypothetical protein G6F56_013499 [Rhizopus delemar]|nr:hypothetical protein G6F56_013499 [Rhizopus delemar]